MTHEEKVKILDQLEKSLVRAETSRKDIDLLVCLRILYALFVEEVKKESKKESEKEDK